MVQTWNQLFLSARCSVVVVGILWWSGCVSGCAPEEERDRGFAQKIEAPEASAAQRPMSQGGEGATRPLQPAGGSDLAPLQGAPSGLQVRVADQTVASAARGTNDAQTSEPVSRARCQAGQQHRSILRVGPSDGLNVRGSPETQGRLLGVLPKDSSVKVWSELPGVGGEPWVCASAQTEDGETITGWLSKEHLVAP